MLGRQTALQLGRAAAASALSSGSAPALGSSAAAAAAASGADLPFSSIRRNERPQKPRTTGLTEIRFGTATVSAAAPPCVAAATRTCVILPWPAAPPLRPSLHPRGPYYAAVTPTYLRELLEAVRTRGALHAAHGPRAPSSACTPRCFLVLLRSTATPPTASSLPGERSASRHAPRCARCWTPPTTTASTSPLGAGSNTC